MFSGNFGQLPIVTLAEVKPLTAPVRTWWPTNLTSMSRGSQSCFGLLILSLASRTSTLQTRGSDETTCDPSLVPKQSCRPHHVGNAQSRLQNMSILQCHAESFLELRSDCSHLSLQLSRALTSVEPFSEMDSANGGDCAAFLLRWFFVAGVDEYLHIAQACNKKCTGKHGLQSMTSKN